MGVHGLTTYLREHPSIAKTLQFSTNHDNNVTFVVDGWSFIYEAHGQAGLPWVYGGEYQQLSRTVQQIARAWLAVGICLHFVFDGPSPELKFPTIISRLTENNIKPSLLFFRTSPPSRSKPKFLRESAMLPPRAYTTCVQALRSLQQEFLDPDRLQLHFGDEEGDPYAVELAARLGGYVVGTDSDFVILNAEGYQGYVPFTHMVWSLESADEPSVDDGWEDSSGFQTVVNSKYSRKRAATQPNTGRGIIPPERTNDDTLELSVLVYAPNDLAAHLQIPLSLLPLLGALVGNDFTGMHHDTGSVTTSQLTNLQWLFFERQLTLSQRITRVATTLRTILTAAFSAKVKGRDKNQVHSVMDLIDRAVTALAVRNLDSMASGEKERVVERVVEATLQYAIPKFEGEPGQQWTSDVCSLHEPDVCPLVLLRAPSKSRPPSDQPSVASTPTSPNTEGYPALNGTEQHRAQGRALYVSAYRSGYLDPHTLDIVHSGTYWHRQFLENPDMEAVASTLVRPIQLWTYAILEELVGTPREVPTLQTEQDEPEEEEAEEEESEDEDELVSVVEESDTDEDDPLAPLRGALQQLNGSSSHLQPTQDDGASLTASQLEAATARQLRPQKIVEEHVRRGSRLAAEDVEVPALTDLLCADADTAASILAAPVEFRLQTFLRALGHSPDQISELVPLLASLPPEQRIPALALRWILSRLLIRAGDSGGSKEREKEKWTKSEAHSFLAAFDWQNLSQVDDDVAELDVPLADRNVQLTAQVLATIDALERLSECLLLSSSSGQEVAAVLPSPSPFLSGKRFHAYLTGTTKPPPAKVPSSDLWRASSIGLEEAFNDIAGAKKRKKDKRSGESAPSPSNAARKNSAVVGGKFGLLASLDHA